MNKIYKVLPNTEWEEAVRSGYFTGSGIDIADGYIHFSTAAQVVETVSKHFRGKSDLLLVCVDADALGTDLKWEKSRNDDLFPHLYGKLALKDAINVQDLIDREDGGHDFPEAF